jgi:hypothetical protein
LYFGHLVLAELGHSQIQSRPLCNFEHRDGRGMGHTGAMGMLIKIRHRDKPPAPWRWEIFDGAQNKLVTAAARPYASRSEAYADGQEVLARMVKEKPAG